MKYDSTTIFKLFVRYLTTQGINYCIVGNADDFPFFIEGDVDIIIPQKQIKTIHSKVISFSNDYGFQIVQCLQHENNAFYYVFQWYEKNVPKFLKIDICGDYYRNARLFLTSKELLSKVKFAEDDEGKKKDFLVAAPSVEFIYYLLKKLDKKHINKKQAIHLQRQWKIDPDGCQGNIHRFWNKDDCVLIKAAMESNCWDPIIEAIPRLRRSIHRKVHFTYKGIFGELRRRIRRVLFPTGITAAFLGPDGSGKSSVAEAVSIELSPAFRKQAIYHLRPFLLRARHKGDGKPVTNPHSSKKYGIVLSLIKLIYLWCDYTIGYYTVIRWKNVFSTFVLFDRYFYDILIDPKRFKYGGPLWLAKLVGQMIPKPDVFIFLSAPADVIQNRKKEVQYTETARQSNDYVKMANMLKKSIIIDASQALNDSIKDANEYVLNYLANRTEKRLLQSREMEFHR